ncbi:hypothetical protein CXQ85_003124 [Candidozyma haemuli]|uniref:Uncharacterized protein n=1 Tax=Candidozyma haemuli TaxID=45357 RepID=A0A2V1AZ93_9ASCO|nr:hypothetical protein CXQ85_003124 [[Candida] haemuloni]PVH23390.1 hypothetical protein CXQ85_003124 [[Candida] haemuloni]
MAQLFTIQLPINQMGSFFNNSIDTSKTTLDIQLDNEELQKFFLHYSQSTSSPQARTLFQSKIDAQLAELVTKPVSSTEIIPAKTTGTVVSDESNVSGSSSGNGASETLVGDILVPKKPVSDLFALKKANHSFVVPQEALEFPGSNFWFDIFSKKQVERPLTFKPTRTAPKITLLVEQFSREYVRTQKAIRAPDVSSKLAMSTVQTKTDASEKVQMVNLQPGSYYHFKRLLKFQKYYDQYKDYLPSVERAEKAYGLSGEPVTAPKPKTVALEEAPIVKVSPVETKKPSPKTSPVDVAKPSVTKPVSPKAPKSFATSIPVVPKDQFLPKYPRLSSDDEEEETQSETPKPETTLVSEAPKTPSASSTEEVKPVEPVTSKQSSSEEQKPNITGGKFQPGQYTHFRNLLKFQKYYDCYKGYIPLVEQAEKDFGLTDVAPIVNPSSNKPVSVAEPLKVSEIKEELTELVEEAVVVDSPTNNLQVSSFSYYHHFMKLHKLCEYYHTYHKCIPQVSQAVKACYSPIVEISPVEIKNASTRLVCPASEGTKNACASGPSKALRPSVELNSLPPLDVSSLASLLHASGPASADSKAPEPSLVASKSLEKPTSSLKVPKPSATPKSSPKKPSPPKKLSPSKVPKSFSTSIPVVPKGPVPSAVPKLSAWGKKTDLKQWRSSSDGEEDDKTVPETVVVSKTTEVPEPPKTSLASVPPKEEVKPVDPPSKTSSGRRLQPGQYTHFRNLLKFQKYFDCYKSYAPLVEQAEKDYGLSDVAPIVDPSLSKPAQPDTELLSLSELKEEVEVVEKPQVVDLPTNNLQVSCFSHYHHLKKLFKLLDYCGTYHQYVPQVTSAVNACHTPLIDILPITLQGASISFNIPKNVIFPIHKELVLLEWAKIDAPVASSDESSSNSSPVLSDDNLIPVVSSSPDAESPKASKDEAHCIEASVASPVLKEPNSSSASNYSYPSHMSSKDKLRRERRLRAAGNKKFPCSPLSSDLSMTGTSTRSLKTGCVKA